MKTRMLWTMLTVVGILAGLGWAAGQNRNQNQNRGSTVVPPATASLTAEETANILRMREEEKLARDVYRIFAEMWKTPIFTNIASAEQRHMDAVGLLITKYGLDDPVTDDKIGVFSSESGFPELYATLTESGAKSLLDALKAGVQIEEKDIADLKTALSQTDKRDIQWVFGNLLRGSSNHLQAFTRCIEAGGTGCSLQGISGGTGNGRGSGNGMCQGCGRVGRGNGNGCRFGNGGGTGNGNQNGMCQQSQQRKRDGSCLQATLADPAQP
jgi:hypothetical protein